MSTGKKSSPNRLSPVVLALSTAAVVAVYGAGFMRTRAAAERLTQTSSRRHPVDMAAVQQVLDVARFTAAPEPTIGAPPVVVGARVTSGHDSVARPVEAPGEAGHDNFTDHTDTGSPDSRPSKTEGVISGFSRTDTDPAPAAAPVPAATIAAEPQALPPTEPPVAPLVATQVLPPAPAPAPPEPPKYNDGRFTGWGHCRHGEIQAEIVIERGRIVSAQITQCLTRYSCDWIAKLPPQVVSRQSPEVDFVSGATESADAFYYAIDEALKKAK